MMLSGFSEESIGFKTLTIPIRVVNQSPRPGVQGFLPVFLRFGKNLIEGFRQNMPQNQIRKPVWIRTKDQTADADTLLFSKNDSRLHAAKQISAGLVWITDHQKGKMKKQAFLGQNEVRVGAKNSNPNGCLYK